MNDENISEINSTNELIVYDKNSELAEIQSDSFNNILVYYKSIDARHYSFSYKIDNNISVNMVESDRQSSSSEFVDAEFDEEVLDSEKVCYYVAAASGLLVGVLKEVGLTGDNDSIAERLHNDKQWKNFVVSLASKLGYMKSDFKGAVKYLADLSVQIIGKDNVDKVKAQAVECLSKVGAHPSVVGLIFSITTQFTGYNYKFQNNDITTSPLPDYYVIGRNYHEKIVYGILYWIFDLSVDVAYSARNIMDDMSFVPKELVKLIKSFLDSDFSKNIPRNYEESIMLYSKWIKKLFENTPIQEESGETKTFDLEESINISMKGMFRETFPIVLNECIVRAFYFVHELTREIKKITDIHSIDDLNTINPKDILPYNNRVISRMCLISSAAYMGVNGGRVVLEYLKGKNVGDRNFKEVLLETIDLPGLCRLCIAVAMDAGYWKEDFNAFYERIRNNKEGNSSHYSEKTFNSARVDVDTEIFEKFTLDALQARLLYSFEAIATEKDIKKTSNPNERELKEEWLEEWKSRVLLGQTMDNTDYFVRDEDLLYEGLFELSKDKDNLTWLYLMGTELVLFTPYHPLGMERDKEFCKLKEEYDYVKDQFIRRQTIVSQAEVDNFIEKYKKYYGLISGNTNKLVMRLGLTAASLVAGGGLALVFAPSIAVLLAGEAVAGLHGAALTSASLAFIGGGSLAAGGLGMAGGTAIIAGGGAILGLASSAGTISITGMLRQMDDVTVIKMSSKLAAFCDVIIRGNFDDKKTIRNLINTIDGILTSSKIELEELKKEKSDLDKDTIDKLRNYIKYMSRLNEILKNINEVK